MKIVLLIISFLLYMLYLDIFKKQVWGFAIAIVLFGAFVLANTYLLQEKKWYIKLAALAVLLVGLVVNACLAAPVEKCISAGDGSKTGYSDVITVKQGRLQGVKNQAGDVETFVGIPYAKPPVGELRWKEPEAPDAWEGVRICDTFAPMAMQARSNPLVSFLSELIGFHENPISLSDNFLEARSEDCLYLNIWKPASAKEGDKLPVLFYVHGGSLNSGQAYYSEYYGETLASEGIIVVNISYRLGVFGYLADDELAKESPNGTTGNYGLLDQIEALKWVNENIEAFGGDADNITLAGESAGSSAVNAICVSPLAKGMFRRVIAESSGIAVQKPYHTFRTLEQAKQVSADIKKEFSCSSIEELRKIPAEKLVDTAYQNNEMTVDGYALVEQPYLTYLAGNNNEEAVLGGYNGDEAFVFKMFSPMPDTDTYVSFLEKIVGGYAEEMAAAMPVSNKKEAKAAYLDVLGIAWFGYSHYSWSGLMAANDKPAYFYCFTKDNKSLGDWHAGELPYFYGNLKNNGNYNESDFALSNTIRAYILNFVKTGDPNGEGLPKWESFDSDPEKVLKLDTEVQMVKNPFLEVFKIIEKYMNDSLDND